MPGQSAHSIKKSKESRISKVRKEGNQKVVDSAIHGDLESAEFGRVLKHLGDGRVRVLTTEGKESVGIIRGLLRKRGTTPIHTDSIVVLSPREYESRTEKVFDIMGVLSVRDADRLKKMGAIPDWICVRSDEKTVADAIEFDHDDADEVEVDKI